MARLFTLQSLRTLMLSLDIMLWNVWQHKIASLVQNLDRWITPLALNLPRTRLLASSIVMTLAMIATASSGNETIEPRKVRGLLNQLKPDQDKRKFCDAKFFFGRMLMNYCQWHKAARQFLIVLQAFPNDAAARGNFAICLQQEGQIEPAIEQYRYILSKEPKNELVLFNLATAYSQKRDWDLAAQYYKAALQLNPANSATYLGLAQCFREKRDDNAASVFYKRGLELRPEMQQNKLRLFERLGDFVPHDDAS